MAVLHQLGCTYAQGFLVGRRMPIGLDDPQIEVAEEFLEPGDRLLLYTDGATEAHSRAGGQFGLQGLIDLVARDFSTLPLTARLLVDHLRARAAAPKEALAAAA